MNRPRPRSRNRSSALALKLDALKQSPNFCFPLSMIQ